MMSLKNIALFFGILYLFFQSYLVMTETIPYPEPGNHNLLAADLFHTIVESKSAENVIFSPIPIETALTVTFGGAKGKTEEVLRQVLRLGSDDRNRVAQNYGGFLKSLIQPNLEEKTSASQLLIANRIFINDNLKISSDFNRIAENNFNVIAENVNFVENKLTTDKINSWVKQQTQDKIKNLLLESDLNAKSNMVLVNGIYFKGKWKNSFNEKLTKTTDFHLNKKEKTPVKMMHTKGTFNYVDLPELEASVLELPLNNSGLNMLFVLPYKIEGLKKLEEKLKGLEFNYIPSRLAPKDVCAYIPKFQLEHDFDLKPDLEKIGLSIIFSDKAEFPGMFDTPVNQYISTFKHKILFKIDENGAEAPLASGECGKDFPSFYADHPFIFAVRSNSAIYLAAHVAKL